MVVDQAGHCVLHVIKLIDFSGMHAAQLLTSLLYFSCAVLVSQPCPLCYLFLRIALVKVLLLM